MGWAGVMDARMSSEMLAEVVRWIGIPPGGQIRSVTTVLDVPSGVRLATSWTGMPIKALSGLARGCVKIGWAEKQVADLFWVLSDWPDGPSSEAIRDWSSLGLHF